MARVTCSILVLYLCSVRFCQCAAASSASGTGPRAAVLQLSTGRTQAKPYQYELTCANRERLEPALSLSIVTAPFVPALAHVHVGNSSWQVASTAPDDARPLPSQRQLCIVRVSVTIELKGRNETTDLLEMDPDPTWYPLLPSSSASSAPASTTTSMGGRNRQLISGSTLTLFPRQDRLLKGVPPNTGLEQGSLPAKPCPGWRVERFNDSSAGTGLTLTPSPTDLSTTQAPGQHIPADAVAYSTLLHLQSCLRRVYFSLSLNADLQAGQAQAGVRSVAWSITTVEGQHVRAISHVAVTPPPLDSTGCRDSPYGYNLQGGPARSSSFSAEAGPRVPWPAVRIVPPPIGAHPARDAYQLPNITPARVMLSAPGSFSLASTSDGVGGPPSPTPCTPLLLQYHPPDSPTSLLLWGYASSFLYESCLSTIAVVRQQPTEREGAAAVSGSISLAVQSERVAGMASAAGIRRSLAWSP